MSSKEAQTVASAISIIDCIREKIEESKECDNWEMVKAFWYIHGCITGFDEFNREDAKALKEKCIRIMEGEADETL